MPGIKTVLNISDNSESFHVVLDADLFAEASRMSGYDREKQWSLNGNFYITGARCKRVLNGDRDVYSSHSKLSPESWDFAIPIAHAMNRVVKEFDKVFGSRFDEVLISDAEFEVLLKRAFVSFRLEAIVTMQQGWFAAKNYTLKHPVEFKTPFNDFVGEARLGEFAQHFHEICMQYALDSGQLTRIEVRGPDSTGSESWGTW